MKKIFLFLLALSFTISSFAQTQTASIDYQTLSNSPNCDIFEPIVSVPMILNGSATSSNHLTQYGDVSYNRDHVLILPTSISNQVQQGTLYNFSFNVQQGYTYSVTVAAAASNSTSDLPPAISVGPGSTAIGSGSVCTGPVVLSHFTAAITVNSQNFINYTFNFVPQTQYTAIGVAVLSNAFAVGSNSVKIRDITINFSPPPCNTNVTITGTYSIALTESGAWIKSSGQTFIKSIADVRLDADPVNGYIELKPDSQSDYFLSQPAFSGQFIAQAYNGCTTGSPSRPGRITEIERTTKKELTENDQTILFPNPCTNALTIKFLPKAVPTILKLFDISGRSVGVYRPLTNQLSIDVSSLAKGVYILKYESGGIYHTEKVIKQ